MNTTYLRFELLRLTRNRQFLFFALGFPLALYLVIAGTAKSQTIELGPVSIGFPLWYMVSMASYGGMIAGLSGGSLIAEERSVGWTRQLRLTPLRPAAYVIAKVVVSYLMCVVSIVLLYIAGISYGVRISPVSRWLEMTGLLLVGFLPFVALGIFLGHLLSNEAMGPALGGGSAFLAFLGGLWFPLPENGFLHYLGQCFPSYWLSQAARIGVGDTGWGVTGWVVVAAWTVLAGLGAAWAYRRDTGRR